MTDYRIELQAFVDAAASFTEPALGHHKAWAEAVARARVALSMPESSASTVCPITPPPELVQQWRRSGPADAAANNAYERHIATQAARWGADAELQACCEWLRENGLFETRIGHLRAARRPKPPSLKEQALIALEEAAYMADDAPPQGICSDQIDVIRHALEQLPE